MVGWHHRFSGHERGQTPGDGKGQGSLACCSPWGHRVGHLATEQLQLGRPPGLPAKQFKRYQPAHGSGRLVSRGTACF